MNARRTAIAFAPRAINRSAAQPPIAATSAIPPNDTPTNQFDFAIDLALLNLSQAGFAWLLARFILELDANGLQLGVRQAFHPDQIVARRLYRADQFVERLAG